MKSVVKWSKQCPEVVAVGDCPKSPVGVETGNFAEALFFFAAVTSCVLYSSRRYISVRTEEEKNRTAESDGKKKCVCAIPTGGYDGKLARGRKCVTDGLRFSPRRGRQTGIEKVCRICLFDLLMKRTVVCAYLWG